MAIVKIQIGATSATLVTIDRGLDMQDIEVIRQEQIKEMPNYHGKLSVNIVGQRKRNFKLKFSNVSNTLYATFSSYALGSRRWWVRIPGYVSNDIFSGFAFVRFGNEAISRVTDTQILYDFTLIIKEL